MVTTEKSIYLIRNELGDVVGTFFAISQEKLEEYIEENNLFPKTTITIDPFDFNDDNHEDVVPIIKSERFLWYELRHRNAIHVVQ